MIIQSFLWPIQNKPWILWQRKFSEIKKCTHTHTSHQWININWTNVYFRLNRKGGKSAPVYRCSFGLIAVQWYWVIQTKHDIGVFSVVVIHLLIMYLDPFVCADLACTFDCKAFTGVIVDDPKHLICCRWREQSMNRQRSIRWLWANLFGSAEFQGFGLIKSPLNNQ